MNMKIEVNRVYMNNNRNNRNNQNNRSNFRPGGKPYQKDGGGARGGFNRFDKPERKDRPYKNANTDRRPASDGAEKRFEKKFDKPFEKKPYEKRFDKPFEKKPYEKKPYEKKFDKPFEKKPYEKKFDKPFEKKPFEKNFDNKFDKKFERKPDRPYKKPPDKPIEKIEKPFAAPPVAEQENSGMVYGRNAVIELLKSGKSIDKLFVQSGQREGSITMIFAEAVKKGVPVVEAEKIKLDSMINNTAHQGVIALASEKEYCSVDDILEIAAERNEKPFILIADKIMDPHNLGAIIRTAECAGVHGMIIPKRHAAGVSPIVAKTSAGASIHMAVAKVANIASTIEELKEKNIWVFAAVLEPDSDSDAAVDTNANVKNYDEADYDTPLALVVGNEGEGLAPIIIQKSDFLVRIPMLGEIKSLNVSCASAVLMYEAAKQRKQQK